MPEDRDRTLSRSLGKFALITTLGIGFLMIVGFGILCSIPIPTPENLTDVEKRYEQVRTVFSSPAPEANLPAEDTSTSPALQLKCDQLFQEMLYSYDSACGETFDQNWVYSKLAKARELAALYDTGVRVSPAAKKKYRLANSYPIGQLAKHLANQVNGEMTAATRCDSIVTALKFIWMIDCPNEHIHMSEIYDPYGSDQNTDASAPLNDLPVEFNKIPLELIAPRKSIDWNFYMQLCLDRARERRKYYEKTLEPGFVYQKERERLNRRGARNAPDMVGNYFEAIFTAILYPRIDGPQNLKTMIQREKNLQDAAAAYQSKKISLEDLVQIMPGSYEMSARLIAAELELRRGTPIPPPDKIGPDSYLFDPLIQQPFKLYAQKETDKTTLLYLRRPIADPNIVRQYSSRYTGDTPTGSNGETAVKMIRLPATHPGLDKITSLTLSTQAEKAPGSTP